MNVAIFVSLTLSMSDQDDHLVFGLATEQAGRTWNGILVAFPWWRCVRMMSRAGANYGLLIHNSTTSISKTETVEGVLIARVVMGERQKVG